MMETYSSFILRYRWLVIALTLVAVGLMARGAGFLTFTNDYRVFFSEDNPQLVAFENLQNTYSKNDNVMMILAPKSGEVFSRESLAAVEWLTEEAWQTPYSFRVDSLSNYQHTFSEFDDLVVTDLVRGAESLSDAQLAEIRDIALNEPLLVNRIIAPDAEVTGVNITVELKGENQTTENPEVVNFVRDLRERFVERYPDFEVKLTGVIMMNNAFPEASQHDMQTLVPIMFLIFLVVLFLLTRGLSGTFVTLLIILFSNIGAMGLAGWMGIALTPPSFSAIMIIPTMAIADSVHLLLSFSNMLHKGESKREAMMDALRINMQPIFLTSVTTMIGFMSMNFSDAPPFRDLGNIVAMGVGLAFVFSVTFLPAMMMVLPVKAKAKQSRGERSMDRFADFVIQKRKILMPSMIGLIVLLAVFVPNNELNDAFVKYFGEEIEFRRDSDYAAEHLSGLYLIDYSLEAGEAGAISEPQYLQHIEDFSNWLREQPEVIHVNVLSDVFKRLNRNMHGDDDAKYTLPDERDLAAQYLLLYEMSLPYGLDLNNQINIDKSSTRMTVMLYNLTTRQVLDLEVRVQDWFEDNLPPEMHTFGASPTVMFSHIGYRNIRSMLTGTTLALVLISFLMIFALRSLKIGLLSLIPNLTPAIMAFGAWGLAVGEVGLALSVVTGMTLGIVVDDSVHFLSKYLRARREKGLDAEQAVRYAFNTVGLALVVTSIVLVAGFMVLSQSAFKLNSDMAFMTAVTIAFALITDFLLLPALLIKLDKNKSAKKPSATEQETENAEVQTAKA